MDWNEWNIINSEVADILHHSNLKGNSMISKLREPVNGLTHLFGAFAALIALIVLLIESKKGEILIISLVIYGISLIGLFASSGIYHSVKANPLTIQKLRKLDHAAIFLLIAGTYTPICLNAFTGFFQWGLLAVVWIIAIAGIIIKIKFMNAPRWLSAGAYVLLGWLCITAIGQMVTVLSPAALGWLICGGIVYTLGAVIYSTKLLNFYPGSFGYHEIWHIFVLLGAAAHFIAVWNIITV